MTTSINDPRVQDFLAEANSPASAQSDEPPELSPPSPDVFNLFSPYLQDDGSWTREFQVRELTGRDEEALARTSTPGQLVTTILERGLVRVGQDTNVRGVLDSIVGTDWDTVLVAIRIVTFGDEITQTLSCGKCREPYEVVLDLRHDIPIRNAKADETNYTVQGRRHTYEVEAPLGATQRKILEQAQTATIAELNTVLLKGCVMGIDGRPPIGDAILDLPMGDRAILLEEIANRRAGLDLQGVKTKCPACGAVQDSPISVAALFQR